MPIDLLQNRQPRPPITGRIRGGITAISEKTGNSYPVQTRTWVFTSTMRQPLDILAKRHGGTVEAYTPMNKTEEEWRLVSDTDSIQVYFPFAEKDANLEIWWELWQRSGRVRQCDGTTCTVTTYTDEDRIDEDTDCICRAQGQEGINDRECDTVSRMRVWLPETGLGLWEYSTTGHHALYGLDDTIAFLSTLLGQNLNRVPMRLDYTPRQIRYKGKTTTKRVPSISMDMNAREALQELASGPVAGVIGLGRAEIPRSLPAGNPSPSGGDEEAAEGPPSVTRGEAAHDPAPSAASTITVSARTKAEALIAQLAKENGGGSTGEREARRIVLAYSKGRKLSWPIVGGWSEQDWQGLHDHLVRVVAESQQVGMLEEAK